MKPSDAYSPINRTLPEIYTVLIDVAKRRRNQGENFTEEIAITPTEIWVRLAMPSHWMLMAQRDGGEVYLVDPEYERRKVIFLPVHDFDAKIRSTITDSTLP